MKARVLTVVTSMLMCGSLHAQVCVVADCTQIADHGTDLLEDRVQLGQTMVLDPWSVPIVRDGTWEGYTHVARQFAIQENMIGLRFNRKMEDGILLYDVMVLHTSEPELEGQIAVQVSGSEGALDPFQFWVVEPKGRTYEGTTAQGFVIRIPLVRFLRYRPWPVFDPKEPVVDENAVATAASQLYGLRNQLKTNVEQVSLATCGASCDLEGLRKTRAVLDEFNKTVQAFSDSLRSKQLALVARKQYRENHGGNGNVDAVVFDQKIVSVEQSNLENTEVKYAAWVQDQITRRFAEHREPGDAASSTDFGSRFGWYVDPVKKKVAANWYPREVEPSTPAGATVYVQFTIARNGGVGVPSIVTPSSSPTLNSSCLHAVERVESFGPLPTGYQEPTLSVAYHCTYPGTAPATTRTASTTQVIYRPAYTRPATPTPTTTPALYHVGVNGVVAPQLLSAVDPQYNEEARLEKIQGVSVVSLVVDEQGNPQRVQVVRHLGHGLDEKAVEAEMRVGVELGFGQPHSPQSANNHRKRRSFNLVSPSQKL